MSSLKTVVWFSSLMVTTLILLLQTADDKKAPYWMLACEWVWMKG
ncbi:hypothetical protein AO373_1058 [Moraxella catarrhalis]|nr:hypothetical protein AO373_1058 [Moraxella catarrhalis]